MPVNVALISGDGNYRQPSGIQCFRGIFFADSDCVHAAYGLLQLFWKPPTFGLNDAPNRF